MMDAKRYLFIGELAQKSSASFGGQAAEGWIDAPLCRDGLGRYTLRGEGQAGALLAMARKLFRAIPPELGGVATRKPSAWRTYTSHPDPASLAATEMRQCVSIDPRTAAAQPGALFDMETLPRGLRWPFLLELDLGLVEAERRVQALAVTARVLQAWVDGYAWLGRGVARGTGWFALENLRALELEKQDDWPNAFAASPLAHAAKLAETRQTSNLPKLIQAKNLAAIPADGAWRWRSYDLALHFAKPEVASYGLAALSIGAHAGYDAAPPYLGKSLLKPEGVTDSEYEKDWKPDRYIAAADSGLLPYIPGSSLRGPLRHKLAWWLRRQGCDPAECEGFARLFGYVKPSDADTKAKAESGALLIRDAFAAPDFKLALLRSHAEDEFSGGVYGNALYDRIAVLEAAFTAQLVLEAAGAAQLDDLESLFQPARFLAEHGYAPLGGASRHGFGRGDWQFGAPRDYGGKW
jgi:CRISPR/Cas system CSM-associated protein Csm3 (group 7 of RAMP superfamily)